LQRSDREKVVFEILDSDGKTVAVFPVSALGSPQEWEFIAVKTARR
jgi:hypothetical protein